MRELALLLALLYPSAHQAPGPALSVNAKSAIIMDADTGKVLWSKNPDTRRFPASTTKILTALLLIEHCPPEEVLTAPKDVEKVTGASLHLKPGEKVTAGEMLYALMLRSANDGCYTVARHIGGSIGGFAELMNDRAKAIGCQNSDFHNPHGLNNDKHVTTARDLALIAREAIKYEAFNKVVKTYKHTIKRSLNKEDLLLISKNKSLKKDATADGIKTGYTNPAGQCFVGSATRNGYRLITVVMKSEDWQKDNGRLLDWAFKHHEREQVAEAGIPTLSVPVDGASEEAVQAEPEKDVFVVKRKGQISFAPALSSRSETRVEAPVRKGQRVGDLVVQDRDGHTFTVPLVASADIAASKPLIGAAGTFDPSHLILASVLGGGAVLVRRRSRSGRFAGRSAALK